jgi:hypothetical protein
MERRYRLRARTGPDIDLTVSQVTGKDTLAARPDQAGEDLRSAVNSPNGLIESRQVHSGRR